jgi:hypothetical protein
MFKKIPCDSLRAEEHNKQLEDYAFFNFVTEKENVLSQISKLKNVNFTSDESLNIMNLS